MMNGKNTSNDSTSDLLTQNLIRSSSNTNTHTQKMMLLNTLEFGQALIKCTIINVWKNWCKVGKLRNEMSPKIIIWVN